MTRDEPIIAVFTIARQRCETRFVDPVAAMLWLGLRYGEGNISEPIEIRDDRIGGDVRQIEGQMLDRWIGYYYEDRNRRLKR